MKSLSINKGHLSSRIDLPSSKSYANRALIISALINEDRTLKNLSSSSDVIFLLNCLKKIGLNLTQVGDNLTISNSFPECEKGDLELEVGEGGTTARFLATMLLLGKHQYDLILGQRLKDRPWEEFIKLATDLGARVSLYDRVLRIQGPVKLPKVMEVDCSKTTQFATAFKLLSVVKDVNVVPRGLESSHSYWQMTQSLVEEMRTKKVFSIPLDWSSASYPLAFGALNHDIFLPNLHLDSLQADAKFFNLLDSFDGVEETPDGVRVRPIKHHHAVFQDVSDCLDLVPTLAFFLSHIEGEHVLSGVKNLIYKESDRLREVIALVQTFKRTIHAEGDSLIIYGSKSLITKKVKLEMPDDHRMVMVATLFLLHHQGGEVSPQSSVEKSFPHFFSLLPSN